MAKLREQPRVQAGQIWRDNDPRNTRPYRHLKVIDTQEGYATLYACLPSSGEVLFRNGRPIETVAKLKRFGGQRSGYVFVSGPRNEFETDFGIGGPREVTIAQLQETDDALIAALDAFEEEEEEEFDDALEDDSEDDSNSYDYYDERYDDVRNEG